MQATLLTSEYPVTVGQREIFCFTGAGPSAYDATNYDALKLPYGIYLDFISGATSVSGTYYVLWKPSAAGGTRASWKAIWMVVATGVPVGNGIDLSAESVQFSALGGAF